MIIILQRLKSRTTLHNVNLKQRVVAVRLQDGRVIVSRVKHAAQQRSQLPACEMYETLPHAKNSTMKRNALISDSNDGE